MSTRVILLGTGTPNAEAERSGPAAALVVNDSVYVVDAGPGVVRRALQGGLEPERLSRVFVTHLHSDHTLGLADLIFTPWTLGREVPLEVIGPGGVADMVSHLRAAYAEDVDERVHGLEPANDTGYRALAQEITAGPVYSDKAVRVSAIPVRHGRWEAFAYRFESAEGVVVFSGDTAPKAELAAAFAGAGLLVHEVYSEQALVRREVAWRRYHRAVHTSGTELGRLAAQARPGLLVLTHQLTWGGTEEELLAEVRACYDGPVIWGRDLQSFEVTRPTRFGADAGAGEAG